jgi:hypothetical protein
MTWVLIIWIALILLWAISVGVGAECEKEGDWQRGCESWVGFGIAIIVVLGILGFFVLSIVWFMTRPKHRKRPQLPARES